MDTASASWIFRIVIAFLVLTIPVLPSLAAQSITWIVKGVNASNLFDVQSRLQTLPGVGSVAVDFRNSYVIIRTEEPEALTNERIQQSLDTIPDVVAIGRVKSPYEKKP